MTTTSLVVSSPSASNLPEYPADVPLSKCKLLTRGNNNAKLAKNQAPTWSLSLSPANTSGHEVCPWRSDGCTQVCVAHCGRAVMYATVPAARIRKTRAFFARRAEFLARVVKELYNANKWCRDRGVIGRVRLNTFSDLPFEQWIVLSAFDSLRFYDYTKSIARARRAATGDALYDNYRLCYSLNERSDERSVMNLIDAGGTVAVVLGDVRYVNSKNKEPMPAEWNGRPLIDGDESDDRANDPRGVFVGLRLKGTKAFKAAGIASGFARSKMVPLTISR